MLEDKFRTNKSAATIPITYLQYVSAAITVKKISVNNLPKTKTVPTLHGHCTDTVRILYVAV